jgi:hypothetical protein
MRDDTAIDKETLNAIVNKYTKEQVISWILEDEDSVYGDTECCGTCGTANVYE